MKAIRTKVMHTGINVYDGQSPADINSPARITAYRADIDGLRGIAVTSVVGFHCGIPWLPGGFFGVDVFFVISGFLIGKILYDEAIAGRLSYSSFYVRRIRRIAPALLAVIFTTTAIALAYLSPAELEKFSVYSIGTLLSIPNLVFLKTTDYFSGNAELNPLLMSWSLGIEEQFYVFFPPLLLLLLRWKRRLLSILVLLSVASFTLNIWLTSSYPKVAFYALPSRAWELGVGVILAIWQSRRVVSHTVSHYGLYPVAKREVLALIGVAMIVASACLYDKRIAIPGYIALVPVFGAIFVIGNKGYLSSLVLSSRPLVFVGLISYSWYLWHWPLLSFARIASDVPLTWHQGVSISAISFAISYISYRFVETPFRRGWKNLSESRWIGTYATVVIGCTLALTGVLFTNGLPSRVSERIAATERDVAYSQRNACLLPYGATVPNMAEQCIAPASAEPVVALLGDSHASALRAGVNDFARRNKMLVSQLTKSSCPTLINVSRVMTAHPRHFLECADFNRRAMDYVLNSPDVRIVILAGYWSASIIEMTSSQGYQSTELQQPFTRPTGLALLSEGLSSTINALIARGKRVIVVDDSPFLGFDPIKHIITTDVAVRRIFASRVLDTLVPDGERTTFVVESDEDVRRSVAGTVNKFYVAGKQVSLYSLKKILCTDLGCQYVKNNKPLFYDQQHISNFGAEVIFSGLR